MKDKRILAMFITSAVALVASVVITLGIALTLADPIPVTFVTTCEFNYGSANTNDKITDNGNVLVYKDAFIYQPTGSLAVKNWDVEATGEKENEVACDAPVFPLKNQEFATELQVEETDATKLEIAYVKVNNTTNENIVINVAAEFDRTSELGKYTKVVVFEYATHKFHTLETQTFTVEASSSSEFAVIVYTDITDKHDANELVFGEAKEQVSVVVTKY